LNERFILLLDSGFQRFDDEKLVKLSNNHKLLVPHHDEFDEFNDDPYQWPDL